MNGKGLPPAVEAAIAATGLCASWPVMAVSAAAIAATSPGPVLFRQERIGRGGRRFELCKFRTMNAGSPGLEVTAKDDRRVTRVGKALRMSKLDELPSLWNVLKGDLSLIGMRPEVPRYVDPSDPLWAPVLEVKPGLVDPLAIHVRDEEQLLADVEGDREAFYRDTIRPFKLLWHAEYQARRTWLSDLRALAETAVVVIAPGLARPIGVEEMAARVARYRAEK